MYKQTAKYRSVNVKKPELKLPTQLKEIVFTYKYLNQTEIETKNDEGHKI